MATRKRKRIPAKAPVKKLSDHPDHRQAEEIKKEDESEDEPTAEDLDAENIEEQIQKDKDRLYSSSDSDEQEEY